MTTPMPTVRVYRNLTRKCLSIQTMTPQGWRVSAHANCVTLDNVRFQVSAMGRESVLRTGRKVVHAYAIGTLAAPLQAVATPLTAPDGSPAQWVGVTYNPRRDITFVDRETRAPIITARRAVLSPSSTVASL